MSMLGYGSSLYVPWIQDKIYRLAKKIVIKTIKDYNMFRSVGRIIKANAYCSIVKREIGVYNKVYNIWNGKKRYGSDIDLAVIAEQGFKAPKSWHYIKSFRNWYDEFTICKIDDYMDELQKMKDTSLHPINFIVMIPGINNLKDSRKHIGFDGDYSRKKGYKVETWYINKRAFRRTK